MKMKTYKETLKKMTILLFCCLYATSLMAQIQWADFKDKKLKLVRYGLYEDGHEVNVFTPSSVNGNEGEYICLNSNGTLLWANKGDGTESFNYRIYGDYCYITRKQTQSWVRLIRKSENLLFTVDNYSCYRYFQIPFTSSQTATSPNVIDFIFPYYFKSTNGETDDTPIQAEGLREFIVRFEMQSTQFVVKIMEVDRLDSDRTYTLETYYINPQTSYLDIDDETLRVTVPEKYNGFTFVYQVGVLCMNDKWSKEGKSLQGRLFHPATGLAQAAIDGLNENTNFEHTRFGETDFSGKFARLKSRFLQYSWKKKQ